MRAVNCWYVEDNGSGQHGYAAVDVIFNYVPPDGYGLYETISEVRKAMKLEEFHIDTVVPHFEGELPVGWKIRDLTTSEINALLGREGEGGGDD